MVEDLVEERDNKPLVKNTFGNNEAWKAKAASIPEGGFLRLPQIIGCRKRGIQGVIPVSRSTWWAGVADGRYPQPVKLSARCTAWRRADIVALMERLAAGQGEQRS